VSIATVPQHDVVLPDTPYAVWARGELHDYLRLPHDGTRVEIIGGEIVVSAAPDFEHNNMIIDIANLVAVAEKAERGHASWRSSLNTGLNLVGLEDGYIPDLMLIEMEIFLEARRDKVRQLVPDQVELVLEVTSRSNAHNDRQPRQARKKSSKWSGYARAEIPYYFLIDRDPKHARVTLYSIPDQATGAYLHEESWEFGETIKLPEQFGIEIATGHWQAWDD
jgi:Uma2 family endonuclease